MLLRDIAHARSGDKGSTSQISVIAHRLSDFGRLSAQITPERVRQHLAAVVRGPVERYQIAHLGILNFILHDALSSGVTRSLALDAHGKCLSSVLLDMPLPTVADGGGGLAAAYPGDEAGAAPSDRWTSA